MPLDREFLEMMPHTIGIEPRTTSLDKYAAHSYGASKSYRCRIVGKGMSIRHDQYEELAALYQIYVDAGNDTITPEDRLTLPNDQAFIGPGGSRTPSIFTVTKETDENGHHHTVISCGWMYHRQGL